MDDKHLDRRRVLSGGLACASVCMVAGKAGARPPTVADDAAGLARVEALQFSDERIVSSAASEEADPHTPFRAAFLAWFADASGRFALPVSVGAITTVAGTSCTKLHVRGVHRAIGITLFDTDICIGVTSPDVYWGGLTCTEVSARPAPDGSGWQNSLLCWRRGPRLHPTREACWREEAFEWLLEWVNGDLAPATHVGLYGDPEYRDNRFWAATHLTRDGIPWRGGRRRPYASNYPLRALLPLHTVPA